MIASGERSLYQTGSIVKNRLLTDHESKAYFTIDLAIGRQLLPFAPDAAMDDFDQDALDGDVAGVKFPR
jgi:hypothetical protein